MDSDDVAGAGRAPGLTDNQLFVLVRLSDLNHNILAFDMGSGDLMGHEESGISS